MKIKKFLSLFILTSILGFTIFQGISIANAGWVSSYFKNNGTYVNGYYRTEPNYYKWDNYSWDGDWFNSYNDKSYYRDYGYDPEPFDDEIPNYDYWDSYDSYDYDYGYDSYDSYDYDSYDYDYGYDNYDSYDYDYSYDLGW